ncbi:MAG: hypothetical protein ACYS32_17560 [Planctomycetota bacterium]|jgi:hypothetical protein
MNKRKLHLITVFAALLIIGLAATGVQAQDDSKAAMKGDKTGTNPINFTHDLRVYKEYLFLNTAGDGNQNITTFEYRTPFADGKWQFRARVRSASIEADLNDDGVDDWDDSGIGDFDFRFLTVPIINMKKKYAVAVGFETSLPTATEVTLGSGALSFGPQVFGVFFAPFGIKGTLIAPAYQHKFSVDEDEGRSEVNQGLIDIFLLWGSSDKQYWALVDPQIILDYEEDKEFMIIDIEAGTMLDRFLGTKGHSAYLRPSFGVGGDRPTDGSIEAGYKVIW